MRKAEQFKAAMEKRLENLNIYGWVGYTKKGTAWLKLSNQLMFEYAPGYNDSRSGRIKRWFRYVKDPTISKLTQTLNKGIAAIIELDRNPIHVLREALCLRASKVEKRIDAKKVDRLIKKSGYSDDYCIMDEAAVKFWNEQFDKKTIMK